MNKQPERTSMTRNILIDTFIELSNQKPINKITLSEISNKAGYNRSTFYQYFNDSYHLLSRIEDDLLIFIKDTVITQIGKDHSEQLFVDNFIQIYNKKRKVLKLLLGNTNNTFSVKLKEALIPLFASQMNLSINDESNIYKLDFYLSGIIAILSRWVTSETPTPPKEYALIVQEIVKRMRTSEIFPLL